MRSFILTIPGILVLSLGLAACGDDGEASATANTTTDTTADSTTEPGATGEPTTGSSTTGPGATTEPEDITTGPGSSTTAPGATTEADSTTDPGTTTDVSTTDPGTTTNGGGGTDVPYVDCSNAMNDPLACPEGSLCVDGVTTNGAVFGSFCAPACSDPDMACPLPEGSAPEIGSMCLFGMGMPTNCALTCFLENNTCPADMNCEDVGLPYGICTHP